MESEGTRRRARRLEPRLQVVWRGLHPLQKSQKFPPGARFTMKGHQLHEKSKAIGATPSSSMERPTPLAKIPKVPLELGEIKNFKKYFEPRVLSVGPYHQGNAKVEQLQKLKIEFTAQFLKPYSITSVQDFFNKTILKEISTLRECYEEKVTKDYVDGNLARMLFFDGCFILHYIQCYVGRGNFKGLNIKDHQVAFVKQDLFLLENQLPFRVLQLLMSKTSKDDGMRTIHEFIKKSINIGRQQQQKPQLPEKVDREQVESKHSPQQLQEKLEQLRQQLNALYKQGVKPELSPEVGTQSVRENWKSLCIEDELGSDQQGMNENHSHLLDLLWKQLVCKPINYNPQHDVDIVSKLYFSMGRGCRRAYNFIFQPKNKGDQNINNQEYDLHAYRNVTELITAGIHLESSRSDFLAGVKFTLFPIKGRLYLPPMIVDYSTGPKLMNLVAYEMSPGFENHGEVTSYICFIDSLIDNPNDVKELRMARILQNFLGSDKEVATLFNEISTDLVPNTDLYKNVKLDIQKHYDNKRKTWMARFKHEHFSTPWSIIAPAAASAVLVMTLLQTIYTILPSECDGLCKRFG